MINFTDLPTRNKFYAGANGAKRAVIYQGEQYMMKDTLKLTSAFPDMTVTMRDTFAVKYEDGYKLWRYFIMSGTNKTYSVYGPASNKPLNSDACIVMSILLPQTENIIRNLAKMCGDPITYLKEDGTEEFKPLSQLLNAENLRESYDENVLFTLETLLDERGGPNLRNENAHGILSPAKGSSGAALCFLSLLIRFLSLYSCESAEVLHKLLQR